MQQSPPDIAILDVGLPEMDGFELARRIRKEPQLAQTLLVALTGYGRATDRAQSRAAGFDEHLVKPVRADELLRLLTDLRRNDSIEGERHAANGHSAASGPTVGTDDAS
jgi:CheY-like chemotaxis protein